MRQALTERQQRLVDLTAGQSDRFAKRAAGHDLANTFPLDNYETCTPRWP